MKYCRGIPLSWYTFFLQKDIPQKTIDKHYSVKTKILKERSTYNVICTLYEEKIMKFEQGMIILKKENPQHIIITKCGIFYYAIGNDALILEKVLKLKKICFKKYICKV